MNRKMCLGVFFVFAFLSILLLVEAEAQGVISLPETGQTKCYNSSGTEISCAGTGQDGELQVGVDWPNPRFTVSGDCVTDNLTGLMWAKDGNRPGGTKTWQEALNYVASINSGSGLCGYHDWRLPNVNELENLVNAGEANSATWLNTQGFSNVRSDVYWSSTTNAYYTYDAWVVHMWGGYVYYYDKSSFYYVWPVRSGQLNSPNPSYPANIWKTGQTTSYASGDDGDLERGVTWPSPRFTDHGDGTVTDDLTGLMWMKNANLEGTKTWQGALDYVKTLSTGGHYDWRLPNRKGLFSLIDRSKYNPALPAQATQVFENVQSSGYWSSSTNAYFTDFAWIVIMWKGFVNYINKSDFNYVWPVRSGQGSLGYPVISVTPNPVEFGSVNVGATSDKQITVQNTGNANLVIGTITSPSFPFSKVADNCSSQTLSLGGTCTVTYRFSPTSATNYSSSSNIPSNDTARNPVTVTLNGTGYISIFSDVPTSYWAYNYILATYNAHITTGCSQNPLKYCPEDNVTREQMAAFIVRAKEGEPASNYCDSELPFTDVTSTMWSCKYIKRLKELGVTTGYGDGRYGPLDTVTREQMAAFIVRAKEGEPAANYCSTNLPFTDVDANSWACKYIKRLKELGVTTGYSDGRYGPLDMVTRAQMAAFLARAFLGMQ